MSAALERVTFSVSRAADFLDARALVSQTGRPEREFGHVVVKELLDNALDACETAGVAPQVEVTVEQAGDRQFVTVADNAGGIPAEVVTRILNFSTLTSDKALYRSPCRGSQGNALKTILGIPHALGVGDSVVIEARGVRHVIRVGLDVTGNVRIQHEQAGSSRLEGTAVTVPLPSHIKGLAGQPVSLDVDPVRWVWGYALVNPHATFTVCERR